MSPYSVDNTFANSSFHFNSNEGGYQKVDPEGETTMYIPNNEEPPSGNNLPTNDTKWANPSPSALPQAVKVDPGNNYSTGHRLLQGFHCIGFLLLVGANIQAASALQSTGDSRGAFYIISRIATILLCLLCAVATFEVLLFSSCSNGITHVFAVSVSSCVLYECPFHFQVKPLTKLSPVFKSWALLGLLQAYISCVSLSLSADVSSC